MGIGFRIKSSLIIKMIDRVVSRVTHSFARAATVFCVTAFSASSIAFAVPTDAVQPIDVSELYGNAHRVLGYGVTFTAETCTEAVPLLDMVIDKTVTGTRHSTRSQALLNRGYCKMVVDDAVGAANLFDEVLDIAEHHPEGLVNIVGSARACLAHLYAQGLGVARDEGRALGFYVSSERYRCDAASYSPAQEAAQLIRSTNPYDVDYEDGLTYRFLRRGSAKDILVAVQLFKEHIASRSGVSPTLIKLAMQGLSAGGGSPADVAAHSELNLQLGQWHLVRGNRALAYGYFLAADSEQARAAIAAAEEQSSFVLMLPTGQHWSSK